jgi:histone-lysine N-methyltransferase SETMAR
VTERTAERWFKRFASGNLSLEVEQLPGRPRIWDSGATKEAAEQPQTSMRKLSDTFGPSKSTIHHHITALGKIYKSCRVVPHELTVEQAQRPVEFCRKLLQLAKDHRSIKRIVTWDEKWIYLNNTDLQKQWLDKGQLPALVAKRERFEKKVLLCIWWNYEGLIYYELVPDGRAISAEVYSQQLEKMYTVLLEKHPALVNPKARVNFSKITLVHARRRKLFRKSKNWKILNCYRIPLLVLILSHQTICFVLWPSSFVVKCFNL